MEKEKELHEQFKHCSGKGEWFAPCEDLLQFIELIKMPKLKEKDNSDNSIKTNENGLIGKFFHSFTERDDFMARPSCW